MDMTNKGLVCAANCCALKKDMIKETWSVTLSLRVVDGEGNAIASGTNISFNNLSDMGYRDFLRILGLDTINEETPFIVQVICPTGKEDKAFVQMSLAERDKKLDGKQTKIAEPPKTPELVPLEEAAAALEDDPKAMKDLVEKSAKAAAGAKTSVDAVKAVADVMENALKKKSAEIVAKKPGSKALDDIETYKKNVDAEVKALGEAADRKLAAERKKKGANDAKKA